MKTKFFGILMVAMLVLQSITFTSVLADNTVESMVVDFSEATPAYTKVDCGGVNDCAVVKGQFGKGSNDASIRLYSMGGTDSTAAQKPSITINTSSVAAAANDQYTHLSFQFLNEDGYSTIAVTVAYIAADGTNKYSKQIVTQSRTATLSQRTTVLPKATGKTNFNCDYGAWHQLDMYFNPASVNPTTYYLDGTKYEVDATKWQNTNTANDGLVKNITQVSLQFIPKSVSPYKASAVQFDNIKVEKVTEIPSAQDYRILGDLYDFEDGAQIAADGTYKVEYAYAATNNTFGSVKLRNDGSFMFENVNRNTIATGVFGKPPYEHSVHTVVPADAAIYTSRLVYKPTHIVLKSGDLAHLSFSFAQNTTEAGNSLRGVNAELTDGAKGIANFINMSSNGNISMFDQDTGKMWQLQKWHKVDFVFKVGNGTNTYTKVDGYFDGEKVLSDYEWIVAEDNYSSLKYIGNLAFGDDPKADYYLDDIAFYVCDSSSLHNPEAGWSLTSANNALSVDDDDAIIGLANDADIAFTAYSDLFANADNVTVYNSAGSIMYAGTLDNDSWVKVSNGFGGGVYYNVGYKYDKLAIGDIAFDSAAQKLTSQAKIGFGINEAKGVEADEVPTNGVVIIALYDGTELVGVNNTPYTSLTSPADVAIDKVVSVAGKTVKVFIFDDMLDVTPLLVNKTINY